jgi:hypothetical protein
MYHRDFPEFDQQAVLAHGNKAIPQPDGNKRNAQQQHFVGVGPLGAQARVIDGSDFVKDRCALEAHVERIADAGLGSGSEVLNEAADGVVEAAPRGSKVPAAATPMLVRNVGFVRRVGGKLFAVAAAKSAKQWNAAAGFAVSVEDEGAGVEAGERWLVGKGSKL